MSRVVLQVVGEVGEVAVDGEAKRMSPDRRARRARTEHLAVRAVVDEPVDEAGHPPRQPARDHAADRLGVCLEPLLGLVEQRVDRRALLVGGDEPVADAPDRRPPLGLEQVLGGRASR